MRFALPGSALVHASLLGLLLVGFAWPEAEDAAAPAPVTVSIVPMSTVSSNSSEVIETDSTVSMQSAGNAATTIEPTTSEVIEPTTDPVEAVTPEAVEPITEPVEQEPPEPVETAQPTQAAETVEPVEVAPLEIAELSSTAESALTAAPVQPSVPVEAVEPAPAEPVAQATPVETATAEPLEAVTEEELSAAPVPQQLSFQRPSKPIVHAPRPPTQRPQTATQTQQPRPQQATPQQAGNGGNSQADSAAAAGGAPPQASNNGNGGNADVARYPSQVTSKLRQALRRASGQAGDVVVRFTVLANGSISGVGISRSSGNSATDQAAIALVQRAAPFPPIPAAAQRSQWDFDVPLSFRR